MDSAIVATVMGAFLTVSFGALAVAFTWFRADMKSGFEKVDARFEKIDARFEKVDGRLKKLEERLGLLEGRFGRLEERLGLLEGRFGRLEEIVRALVVSRARSRPARDAEESERSEADD